MRKITLPVEILELEEGNFHLLVSSAFADGSQGRWVIDTGASRSVFDSSLGQYYKVIDDDSENEMLSAGIGSGSFESKTGLIKKIWFGDFKKSRFRVVLIDLGHINELYEKYGSGKICGLVGSDFLMKYKAVINFKTSQLVLKV